MKLLKLPIQTLIKMVEYNKKMKSNIIVWSNELHTIVGYCVDDNNPSVLKFLNKPYTPNLSYVPNLVFMAKDLSSIIKTAEEKDNGEDDVCIIKINDMHYPNVFVEEIWYDGIVKYGYDYFKYFNKTISVINELQSSKIINKVQNIQNIPEFSYLMTAKATDGIIKISYQDIVYFLPAAIINFLKKDTIDIEVYQGSFGYFIKIMLYKPSNLVETILYRIANCRL